METLNTVLIVVHIVISFLLIGAILLQSGKGSGLAAGFGGASAGTQVFGGSGAGGFLSKASVWLGALFMATSLSLAYLSSQPKSAMSLEGSGAQTVQEDEIVSPGGEGGAAPAEAEGADDAAAPGTLELEQVEEPAGEQGGAAAPAEGSEAPGVGGEEAPAEGEAGGDEQ